MSARIAHYARRSWALAVVLLVAPGPARATLADPSAAQANADAARKAEAMSFCRAPRRPLAPRALALCPAARELPDCAGFAAACDAALAPKAPEQHGELLASLKRALGLLAQALVYLLVAGVAFAIAYPIIQAIRRRRRDAALADTLPAASALPEAPGAPQDLPTVDDADAALRHADDLARGGELDRATYMYLSAALTALDHRGAIRLAKSRTNGEYVRACAEAAGRPLLRAAVREVDRVQFGGEPPTTERVSKLASLARALVRALPVAALALAVLGCSGGPLVRHDDPAGDQLLAEVLTRQGFKVSATGHALASLAPLKPDETAPVLVVDLDRTPLEPDAEARLVAWVDSGGVLMLLGSSSSALAAAFGYHDGPPAERNARGTVDLDAWLTPLEPPTLAHDDDDDDDDVHEQRLAAARSAATRHLRGAVLRGGTVEVGGGVPLIVTGSGPFAAAKAHGKGVVVLVHDGALFTNVEMARAGNPGVVAALFTELMAQPALTGAPDERRTRVERPVRIARPEDGISPPSNPISALARAGRERGMWHALVACLVLFAAYGVRHARPRPAAPPTRRAFAEHIEATGAFYARLPQPRHALAAYSRFAEERLRQNLPRGASEVPALLASRTGRSLEDCEALWSRATSEGDADPSTPPRGDELTTLRELRALLAAALRPEAHMSATHHPQAKKPDSTRIPS